MVARPKRGVATKRAKRTVKSHAAPGWTQMTNVEIRLAKTWYNDEKLPPSQIAKRLGRNKSSLTRLLVKQTKRKPQGRPRALSKAQVDLLEKRLHQLVVKADKQYTVTVAMLKKNARIKASERVILEALHERNIYFRATRGKPLLTEQDVRDRFAFAQKYRGHSPAWWRQKLHAVIDAKHFAAYSNSSGRARAAMHGTRGAYRSPGKGLHGAYVKPRKGEKFNTGARNSLVVAAVGGGKVSMWNEVRDSRWNGSVAAKMCPLWPFVSSHIRS